MNKQDPKKVTALFVRDVIIKNAKSLEDIEKILKDITVFLARIDCVENKLLCRELKVNVAKILQLAALCPSEDEFRATLDDIITIK